MAKKTRQLKSTLITAAGRFMRAVTYFCLVFDTRYLPLDPNMGVAEDRGFGSSVIVMVQNRLTI